MTNKDRRKVSIAIVDSLWVSFIVFLVLYIPALKEWLINLPETISQISGYSRLYDVLLAGVWSFIIFIWAFIVFPGQNAIYRWGNILFISGAIMGGIVFGIYRGFLISIILTVLAAALLGFLYILAGLAEKTVRLHKKLISKK